MITLSGPVVQLGNYYIGGEEKPLRQIGWEPPDVWHDVIVGCTAKQTLLTVQRVHSSQEDCGFT
jgi:hypothetical protein